METGWQPVIDVALALSWGWNIIVVLTIIRGLTVRPRNRQRYVIDRRISNVNGKLVPYYIFMVDKPAIYVSYWATDAKKHTAILAHSSGIPRSIIKDMHRRKR